MLTFVSLLPSPGAAADDVVGQLGRHIVREGETLHRIALAEQLGFVELRAANPDVDPWLPEPGRGLVLPRAHVLPDAPRRGIVVNLGDQRLYHFGPDGALMTHVPVGIGRAGWETPTGETAVINKRENPTWIPPPSIRAERPELPAAVPPGPRNPLGAYALDLGIPGIVIHGTNRLFGIGRRVSHGCVRLYPAHIAALFQAVEVGTPVNIVDQPVKLGWRGGALFLEVHPNQAQADQVARSGRFTPHPIEGLVERITRAIGRRSAAIDWPAVAAAAEERRGVPVRITKRDTPPSQDFGLY